MGKHRWKIWKIDPGNSDTIIFRCMLCGEYRTIDYGDPYAKDIEEYEDGCDYEFGV